MKLECILLSLTRKMIDGTERYRLRVEPSGCAISGHSFVCNRQLSQLALSFFLLQASLAANYSLLNIVQYINVLFDEYTVLYAVCSSSCEHACPVLASDLHNLVR